MEAPTRVTLHSDAPSLWSRACLAFLVLLCGLFHSAPAEERPSSRSGGSFVAAPGLAVASSSPSETQVTPSTAATVRITGTRLSGDVLTVSVHLTTEAEVLEQVVTPRLRVGDEEFRATEARLPGLIDAFVPLAEDFKITLGHTKPANLELRFRLFAAVSAAELLIGELPPVPLDLATALRHLMNREGTAELALVDVSRSKRDEVVLRLTLSVPGPEMAELARFVPTLEAGGPPQKCQLRLPGSGLMEQFANVADAFSLTTNGTSTLEIKCRSAGKVGPATLRLSTFPDFAVSLPQ